MSFTEHQEHLIEINPPFYILTVEQSDIIKKSGEEVGRQYTRFTYHPGDDISEAPQDVQTAANAFWTQQVISDYQQTLIEEPTPLEPPLSEVTETIAFDSATATAIYAGASPATSDPNGVYTGWLYNSPGDGSKAHWYIFGQDVQDPNDTVYTLGEISSIYLQLRNLSDGTTSIPHINIYTYPQGDGADAESWYRSRVTYDLTQPEQTLMVGTDQFITWVTNRPHVYTDQPHAEMLPSDAYSAGPQASSEVIAAIAISTDSSASAGEYQFALDKFGLTTSDQRYLCKTTSGISESQSADQSSDQTNDQTTDQTTDQPTDQPTDQTTDQPTDQPDDQYGA